MYVDRSTVRSKSGKSYTRYLLRESYRENGKVKHRTIANLSKCKPPEIEAIRLALRHKADLTQLAGVRQDVQLEQGLSIGAVWTVHQVARELGIAKALGSDRQGKLALWQVIARVIDQGSRLSAVRLDVTVQEGLDQLATLCATNVTIQDQFRCQKIPQPRPDLKQLLDAAGIRLPEALPCKAVKVTTKRKLPSRRKTR